MIVLVDNYDSFTFNLVQLIAGETSLEIEVVRNDAFDVDALVASRPDAIVISPGPGTPAAAGNIVPLVRAAVSAPILGICLGHQAIAEAFGARVVRGPVPVHGKVDAVRHRGERLFEGCPDPLRVTRYHSLVAEAATLPAELTIDAMADDGSVMALSHATRPVFGLQFHPESWGTSEGARMVRNFLAAGGIA
jgi:anthranilate synthase component II